MFEVTEEQGPVDQKGSSLNPEDPILFVGISLVLGIALRQLLRGTTVPYTAALLLLGIGLGAVEYWTRPGLGKLGASIRAWSDINPNLILFVFLPSLLFESSFTMEIRQIKRCMVQMALLAAPGVVISTFCLGTAIHFLFPYDWNWKISLLLGGLLSATDPVAVVALLKELGASKKLNTIIEGESLMNDGTAIVVYRLFFQMVLGHTFNWTSVILFLSQVTLGAVALGLAFGLVSFLWLGVIFSDTVIEITLTLTVSYLAYYTAEVGAEVSGVLTVVTLGMFYVVIARTTFKGESWQNLHHFWEMVSYIGNTLIFILSGVLIVESILENQNTFTDQSWGLLILLYVLLQVSRVIVVAVLYPGLRYFGDGLDLKEALILIWSGLRGAVALSLSLEVKRSSDNLGIPQLTQRTGALFVFFTGGVVFLSLVLNGSTTQVLLHLLGMDRASDTERDIVEYTKYEMYNEVLTKFRDSRGDQELGPADWSLMVSYIKCLPRDRILPPDMSINDNEQHKMDIQDSRLRLLNDKMQHTQLRRRLHNVVQAAYWGMLGERRIIQTADTRLMQSIDEAISRFNSHETLLDSRGLADRVQFGSYFKYLQKSCLLQKLVTFFSVRKLESACYVCAAFLRAHEIARKQLRDFIGESEVAEDVIRVSEAEVEPATQFLEEVQRTFPEVLHVLRTKQVTYSILLHLSEYVQNLEKRGLLEAEEMNQLHEAVQSDLKNLLTNPPLVRMPSVTAKFSGHPFWEALAPDIRQPLGNTQTIILRKASLYTEGSKPDGIWLIANGDVQWRRMHTANRHSPRPTVSEGSTWGLYEALTGKRRLCDLTADSLLCCCFIEREKILAAFRSTSALLNLFWRESAMVVAKLLLPQKFEEHSMQEMRTVFERSTMHTYSIGEEIDILPCSVAILLEGAVTQVGRDELTTPAPAHLGPSDLTSAGSTQPSAAHQGTRFKANEPSRVIVFGFNSIDSDNHYCNASTSLV